MVRASADRRRGSVRRLGRFRWLGLLFAACVTCQAPPPRVQPTGHSPQTPSASGPAVRPEWRLIDVAPDSPSSIRHQVPTSSGTLRVDSSGVRWLITPHDESAHAGQADVWVQDQLAWVDGTGLVRVDRHRRIHLARKPLDVWTDRGPIPDGAKASTLTAFRRGLSLGGTHAPSWTADLTQWRSPAGLRDRAPLSVLMGMDGSGIGIFLPQGMAITRDGGFTWLPQKQSGLFASLDCRDGKTAVVSPGRFPEANPLVWEPSDLSPRDCTASDVACTSQVAPAPGFTAQQTGLPSHGRNGLRRGPTQSLWTWALDGNTIVMASHDQGGLGRGVLGGPLRWEPRWETLQTACSGYYAVRMSACAGYTAFACGNQLAIELPTGQRALLKLAFDADAVIERPGVVLAVGRDSAARIQAHNGQWSVTPIRAPSPVSNDQDPTSLVSGCATNGQPPHSTFALAGKDVFIVGPEGFRRLASLDSPPSSAFAPVVGADGALTVANQARDNLVIVSPNGEVTQHSLGFTFDGTANLASLSAGRGLLLDQAWRAHETLDGGRSWHPVGSPPRPLDTEAKSTILCGPLRCELDDVAVRVGWGRPEPESAEPTGSFHDTRHKYEFPTLWECPQSSPVVIRKEGQILRHARIFPGVGGSAWSIVGDYYDSGRARLLVIFGMADGRSVERVIWTGKQSRDWLELNWDWSAHVGSGLLVRNCLTDPAGTGASCETMVDMGPGTTARWVPSADAVIPLFTDSGAAFLEPDRGRLVWVREGGQVEAREMQVNPLRSGGSGVPRTSNGSLRASYGSLVADADGRWVVGLPFPLDGAPVGAMLLIGIEKSGQARWNVARLAAFPFLESGASVARHDNRAGMVSWEWVMEEGFEWRWRPLSSDLTLGDATVVPHTRSPLGRLSLLPACKQGARGAVVLLTSTDKHVMQVMRNGSYSSSRSHFVRRIRVSNSAACVERTMMVEDPEERPHYELVAAGQGEGAAIFSIAPNSRAYWRAQCSQPTLAAAAGPE